MRIPRISAFQSRLLILILVLLVGFALRLYQLNVANLNIDESWSYVNSFYLAHPSGYTAVQILAPEPGNAIHLMLASLNLTVLTGAFGIRWLSVMAGILTVALTARAAFRLYGRQAALIAGVMAAVAYAPVTYSQIARPYALATMLALLSTVLWLEKRSRLNMLASLFVPLAHIGAMPVIVTQDVLTLWSIRQGKRVRKVDWLIRRVPAYVMFFVVVFTAYQRRDIHVISSGQSAPSPGDLINTTLNVIVNGFPALNAATILFLVVVAALVLIAIRYWRNLPKNFGLPLIWIGLSYGFLIAGAVLSDGPIKWVHITHVALALVLIMAGVLAQAPRVVRGGVLVVFCLASAISLGTFYAQPDRSWSEALAEVAALRQGDEMIYLQQPTILWAFQLNNQSADYLRQLPTEGERPAHYLYIETAGWLPPAPAECAPEVIWSRSDGLRALACRHGT